MGNTKYKHTQIGDIAMRHLLAAVFVILALFAVSNVYAGELSVTKCTVTAGSKVDSDKISFSGTMDATADDFNGANVVVTIDFNDMVSPCVKTFPINGTTFKKGKFNCSVSNASFTLDTKTSKFSFTAKNVSLKGLSCPFNIEINIGGYNATTEVYEDEVNGPKSPIPIKLMMGIKNVLRVDSYKVTQGKKLNSDQLTVKGGFAVEDVDVNMVDRASEGLVITLGTQTFTIPANNLKVGKGIFSCSNAKITGGTASATFNFNTCSFTITIKNTKIEADAGGADFGLEFGDFNVTQTLCTFTISPTAKSFTASGGDGSVTVTTSNGCDWTATSHASWIIITSGNSGSGSGTVGYSVAANGGTAKRTGTMTIAGQTFNVTQSSGGATGLTISSLSTSSAAPFSPLTITGSGFDPANSAISVLFAPNGSGVPIAVPVFSASANSIKVIVPPFLDRTSGFSSGVMTVQAIQVSGSFLMTSNTIGGLNVGSLPSIPTSDPAGAVTGSRINSGLMLLQNIQTFAGSTPSYADLLSASNALGSDMNSSLQAINSIKANPTQSQNLATMNGSPFVLDAATLAASDRLVLAYLQQFLNFVQTSSAVSLTTAVPPRSTQDSDCIQTQMAYGHSYGIAEELCGSQAYDQQFAQVGSAILPSAAAFVYGQWLALSGSLAATELLAAGATESVVNAFQLAWAASGPYVSALAAGGPAPTLKEPATEVATTLIDNVLNGAGTVLSGVLFGADLFSTANQVSSAPIGSAPTGGLIVSDPTTQAPPGSNALLSVQGFGDNASVLSVMAPKSQATVSLCTFSYSDWSPCQPDGTQTRTVISSSPPGCVGTPVLSQSCTYNSLVPDVPTLPNACSACIPLVAPVQACVTDCSAWCYPDVPGDCEAVQDSVNACGLACLANLLSCLETECGYTP
jgi:hypothetical protein